MSEALPTHYQASNARPNILTAVMGPRQAPGHSGPGCVNPAQKDAVPAIRFDQHARPDGLARHRLVLDKIEPIARGRQVARGRPDHHDAPIDDCEHVDHRHLE